MDSIRDVGTSLLSATFGVTRRTLDVTTGAVGGLTSRTIDLTSAAVKSTVDVVRKKITKLSNKEGPSRDIIKKRLHQPFSEWELSQTEELRVLEMNFISLLEICEELMRSEPGNAKDETKCTWHPNPPKTNDSPLPTLVLYLKQNFEQLKEKQQNGLQLLDSRNDFSDFHRQIQVLEHFVADRKTDFKPTSSKEKKVLESVKIYEHEKQAPEIVPKKNIVKKKYTRFSQKQRRRKAATSRKGTVSLLQENENQREKLEEQLVDLTDSFLAKSRDVGDKLRAQKVKWDEVGEATDENLDGVQLVTKKTEEFIANTCSQQCWLWFGMVCVVCVWFLTYFVIRFFRIESRWKFSGADDSSALPTG